MMRKTALITGITGQDGGYLAAFLLDKGYDVHGLVRWDAVEGTGRLKALNIIDKVSLSYGELTDAGSVTALVNQIKPDEIYNLAALSHVAVSFQTPAAALDTNAKGTLNILEAIRILGLEKQTRLYQASSSEMFGSSPPPQNEDTPFAPCSPYGVAKLAAYWLVRTYRDSYGIFASNGILFNHESPLRGGDFVTQKIVNAVKAIQAGERDTLFLGNIDAKRDWGHAKDYVRGMWMMLQHQKADDFVLATGQMHSVREFVVRAFAHVNVDIRWQGKGMDEVGLCNTTGKVLVRIDPALFRPKDVDELRGDAAKAQNILGWNAKYDLCDLLVDMMGAETTNSALDVAC